MAATQNIRADDSYLEQVRKLIPAEITGAFLAINALIPFEANIWWTRGFFVVLVPCCWAYARLVHDITRTRQLVFISFIAFPAWALAVAIDRIDTFDLATDNRFAVTCVLVVVSLLSPLFFQGGNPFGQTSTTPAPTPPPGND